MGPLCCPQVSTVPGNWYPNCCQFLSEGVSNIESIVGSLQFSLLVLVTSHCPADIQFTQVVPKPQLLRSKQTESEPPPQTELSIEAAEEEKSHVSLIPPEERW